jgi:hypothetical protein
MAVVLVVEDGTGIVAANSYLTAAEADSILEVNPSSFAVWDALSAAQKDAYLVWASQYIDDYVEWAGYKTVPTSGLRWPRCGVYDRDGILIAEDVLPEQLLNAVAQIAVFLINNEAASSGGQSSNLPEGIKRVKADVVELEFFESGSADSQSGTDLMPLNIAYLIRGLGRVITGRARYTDLVR